jgi:hypothetical protein
VFPNAATEICAAHQIRNCCRYVTYKDLKEFTKDLKTIYGAVNKDSAALALDASEQKWGKKYQYAVRSWRTNWDDLPTFLDYPMEIRKIIYTTNLIENLNGKIRNIPRQNYLSHLVVSLDKFIEIGLKSLSPTQRGSDKIEISTLLMLGNSHCLQRESSGLSFSIKFLR